MGVGASDHHGSAALRPQLLVLILAALAPYDGLLLLLPSASFLEVWKDALIVVLLARAWQFRGRSAVGPVPPWAAPAAGLLALAIGSAVLHPGLTSIAGIKIGFFYLVTLPLAVWLAPLGQRDRDRLVTIMMVNAVIVSIVGIGQQFVGHGALHDLGYEYDEVIRFTQGWLRSFSTFNQPFPFAFFVMIAMLIGIPVALEDRLRLRNRLFLWSQPVLAIGVLVSFVRGALLGLLVGLAVLSVRRYRILNRLLILLPIAALVVVAAGGASAVLSTRSLEARVTGWVSEVVDQGIEPLGLGIGTTGSAAELFPPDPNVFPTSARGGSYQPDNYFVKTLIELGPIGLWLFISILVTIWTQSKRLLRTTVDSADRGLVHGTSALLVASVPVGLISSFWEIFPADMFFWLLVGVITSLQRPSSSMQCSSSPSASEGACRSTVAS